MEKSVDNEKRLKARLYARGFKKATKTAQHVPEKALTSVIQ